MVKTMTPLYNYLQSIQLPNKSLITNTISTVFFEKDIHDFWKAIQYVYQLPYGRTTHRDNYLEILTEEKGACSGKHALIAALAEELEIPLHLFLGIFLITAENTPGIASILKHHNLEAIPEAHCYLKYNHHTLDITFPGNNNFVFDTVLEKEITISPDQIGSFKLKTHQEFIIKWIKTKHNLDFDLIWTAREEWIAELSKLNCNK